MIYDITVEAKKSSAPTIAELTGTHWQSDSDTGCDRAKFWESGPVKTWKLLVLGNNPSELGLPRLTKITQVDFICSSWKFDTGSSQARIAADGCLHVRRQGGEATINYHVKATISENQSLELFDQHKGKPCSRFQLSGLRPVIRKQGGGFAVYSSHDIQGRLICSDGVRLTQLPTDTNSSIQLIPSDQSGPTVSPSPSQPVQPSMRCALPTSADWTVKSRRPHMLYAPLLAQPKMGSNYPTSSNMWRQVSGGQAPLYPVKHGRGALPSLWTSAEQLSLVETSGGSFNSSYQPVADSSLPAPKDWVWDLT